MRNLGLDLLRFIAVFLVIGVHLHLPDNPNFVLATWARGGWIGVDLFFVLSGFLVSSLLFKEHLRNGKLHVGRFLIRRGFKIYPAFWVLLLVSLFVREATGDPPALKNKLGEILFLQNYLGGLWAHTWSLAVEEHFYLGIAALFLVIMAINPKTGFRIIPVAFAVIALVCLGLRMLNPLIYQEYSHQNFLYGTHIRVDSLFFGVLIAYLFHYKDLAKRIQNIPTVVLIGLGGALLTPAFVFSLEEHIWISVVGVILFYLGSGSILMGAIRLEAPSNRVLNFFGRLGGASYSVYLWHMPLSIWGYAILKGVFGIDNFLVYLVLYVTGSFAIGWAMNHLVESPVLLLRERLFPSKIKATEPSKVHTDTNS